MWFAAMWRMYGVAGWKSATKLYAPDIFSKKACRYYPGNFVQEQAAQCGYCLNGMVITAVCLLDENPHPDDKAIREGMQRSLCRCGSYARVIRAIKRAAGLV